MNWWRVSRRRRDRRRAFLAQLTRKPIVSRVVAAAASSRRRQPATPVLRVASALRVTAPSRCGFGRPRLCRPIWPDCPTKSWLQKSPSRAERSRLASVSERPRGAGLGLEREHGSGMLCRGHQSDSGSYLRGRNRRRRSARLTHIVERLRERGRIDRIAAAGLKILLNDILRRRTCARLRGRVSGGNFSDHGQRKDHG